ncbi:MAG: hypothetical protein JWQ09_488 [Segetibacter sp.]|nr:hypothetical protein [Segetibacter sp.]
MSLNLFSNQVPEVPFNKEVAFEYKKELYKVHVNVLTEKDETVYKLYFKNNIEETDKSLMKLVRRNNAVGSYSWTCITDYFSYINNEIAAIAGVAIDGVLQEKSH